jgi:hypothetical protein
MPKLFSPAKKLQVNKKKTPYLGMEGGKMVKPWEGLQNKN